MRTLLALVALCAFSASTPPAQEVIEGQMPRSDGIHLGSKTTAVRLDGNVNVFSTDGGLTIERGDLTISSGNVTASGSTYKVAVIDAGVLYVNGQAQFAGTTPSFRVDVLDAGVALFNGTVQLKTPITCGAAGVCGSVALSSGTPSTATVTVPAGVTCACWPIGITAVIAAAGCAANVSSTTLTLTGPNTVTTTMRYMCFL